MTVKIVFRGEDGNDYTIDQMLSLSMGGRLTVVTSAEHEAHEGHAFTSSAVDATLADGSVSITDADNAAQKAEIGSRIISQAIDVYPCDPIKTLDSPKDPSTPPTRANTKAPGQKPLDMTPRTAYTTQRLTKKHE